jgi:hypothetical protein
MKISLSLRIREALKRKFGRRGQFVPAEQAFPTTLNPAPPRNPSLDSDGAPEKDPFGTLNSKVAQEPRQKEPELRGTRDDCLTVDAHQNKRGEWVLEKSSTGYLEINTKPDTTLDPYCMVVTRWFNDKNRHEKTTLEIKSPLLIQALRKLITYYPDNPDLTIGKVIKVEDPPAMIYHYRQELAEYAQSDAIDAKTKLHINYVLKYLRVHMGETIDEHETHLSLGLVHFQNLWMIFRSGDLVYEPGSDQLWFFEQGSYTDICGSKVFALKCHRINYNGKDVGTESSTLYIPVYQNPRELTALPVYPQGFHENPEELRQRMLERGRVFLDLRGVQMRDHKVSILLKLFLHFRANSNNQ